MAIDPKTNRDDQPPRTVNNNDFRDTVMRTGYQVGLAVATAGAIALGGSLTRAQVEDAATRSEGIIDLGCGDGLRLVFVVEPGPTSPIVQVTQLEPVMLASNPSLVGGYMERPLLDTAVVALTEGTGTIGAGLATALANGAANTWRYVHTIGTPAAAQPGVTVFSPGGNLSGHIDFYPLQATRYLRIYLSQTTTTKKILACYRRLRGDAQGL